MGEIPNTGIGVIEIVPISYVIDFDREANLKSVPDVDLPMLVAFGAAP